MHINAKAHWHVYLMYLSPPGVSPFREFLFFPKKLLREFLCFPKKLLPVALLPPLHALRHRLANSRARCLLDGAQQGPYHCFQPARVMGGAAGIYHVGVHPISGHTRGRSGTLHRVSTKLFNVLEQYVLHGHH